MSDFDSKYLIEGPFNDSKKFFLRFLKVYKFSIDWFFFRPRNRSEHLPIARE